MSGLLRRLRLRQAKRRIRWCEKQIARPDFWDHSATAALITQEHARLTRLHDSLAGPSGTTFLVHGECHQCGWWAACPEGAIWPSCPQCGLLVLPPKPSSDEERLGYLAFLSEEQEAVTAALRLGYDSMRPPHRKPAPASPWLTSQ